MAKRRPCAKCGRNRAEKFFSSPRGRTCVTCRKGRVSSSARAARLLETYGITLDDYAAILAAQGGRCAICERTPRYNMDVDHDHQSGMVRGLLCKLCNRRLLPAVRDDARTLASAILYLDKPPAMAAIGAVTVPNHMEKQR